MSKMFNPNAELLQFIGFGEEEQKEKRGTYVLMQIPTRPDDYGEYGYVHAMIVNASFDQFREILFKEDYIKEKWAQITCGHIFGEMIYNAAFHGNKCDPAKKIDIGVWFGSRGMLFGVKDEGSFFRSPKVKEMVEKLEDIPSSTGSASRGDGMDQIQEADKVFVSNEENTLYAAVLLSNLEKE